MDFVKWYRSVIESARPEPDHKVWEEIENELDIDLVWTGIENELHGRSRSRTLVYLAAAASVLLAMGIGSLLYFSSGAPETIPASTLQSHHIHQPADDFVRSVPFATLSTPSAMPLYRAFVGDQDSGSETGVSDRQLPGTGLNRIFPIQIVSVEESTGSRYEPGISNQPGEHEVSDVMPKRPSRVYAGINGHFANTWLLNDKTLEGLRSDELTASLPSFGYSIGLHAGRQIAERVDLQVDLLLLSVARQNYNEYLHGQYVNTNMSFNYTGFTLSGKYHIGRFNQRDGHALIVGGYIGLLNSARQQLNGEQSSLTREYNPVDFGLVAGYEYNFPVGNRISLATGLQTRYGLNNIFSGNELIPGYLNSTRNASVNLTFSIRYLP